MCLAQAAFGAFVRIDLHFPDRESGARFHQYRNRTYVFAKCTVILKNRSQNNGNRKIGRITDEQPVEFHEGAAGKITHAIAIPEYEHQSQCREKMKITKKPPIAQSALFRFYPRQKVDNHGRPAGPAAPAATE